MAEAGASELNRIDYRVTVKVRNNRILKAIENVGGTPGQKWCEGVGLSYSTINDFINLTLSPLTAELELRTQAQRLCDVTGCLPDELWSSEQVRPLERNFTSLEMTHEQVVAMLPDHEQIYLPDLDQFEMREVVAKVLETLTQQEQEVLRGRMWNGETLAEIGARLDRSTERIAQIEAKALRKLRHPGRVEKLKPLLTGDAQCK